MSLGWAQVLILIVALQRVGELWLSSRNVRRLRAAGGREVGAGHYPFIVAVHVAWLAVIFVAVPPQRAPDWPLLAVYAVLEAARAWVMVTLGRYWTTRIITLAGAPVVTGGPYRFVRHPNYLIVAAEIAVLPLAFGAWRIALLFTVLNAMVLAVRIRTEDAALAERRRRTEHGAPSIDH
jgi:methyltransferase